MKLDFPGITKWPSYYKNMAQNIQWCKNEWWGNLYNVHEGQKFHCNANLLVENLRDDRAMLVSL